MLRESPSCHLLAVILVNLTNVQDDDLMVSIGRTYGLVESLLFTLRVSLLTKAEYEDRIAVIEECNDQVLHSPSHRLLILMAEDHRLRSWSKRKTIVSDKVLFPDTSRWCLCAIKNLTKAGTAHLEQEAADILIKSGCLTIILQYITIPVSMGGGGGGLDHKRGSLSLSTILEAAPVEGVYQNQPFNWSSQSGQHIALSIILNICESSNSREHIDVQNTINVLSAIVKYPSVLKDNDLDVEFDQKQQMDLYCFKAVSFKIEMSLSSGII
jgi:hypothetical protein